MRKLLFPIIAIIISACSPEKIQVKVTGKITNPLSQTVSIICDTTTYTDSLINGQFSIFISTNESTYVRLKHANESTQMHITPGDDIYLNLNTNQFDESILYTGSNNSNYLAKKYLFEEEYLNRALYSSELDSFLIRINEFGKKLSESLKLCTDEKFSTEQKLNTQLDIARIKLLYPEYYKYITGNEIMLDDEYNNFMNSIDLNDAYMLDYEGYKSLLKTYVYSHAEQIDSIFHFIQLNFNNQKVTNYLSYTLFKEHLNYEEVLYIDSLMTSYGMLQSNEDYYLELFDLANELKKFQKGQTAINFSYPDINGDTIALSDFIGSYVYVDVWATWCGPCKREIPDLIKLEHDYADKNIVFMSISVDEEEDRNTWLTMVNERGLGGVQLFASGWSHITKSYKINGIPRFMLFDPEGNIINVRATRPSDPNTRIVFDEILL